MSGVRAVHACMRVRSASVEVEMGEMGKVSDVRVESGQQDDRYIIR